MLINKEFSNKDEEIPHEDARENIDEVAKDSLEASDNEAKSFFYHVNEGSGSNIDDKFAYAKGSKSSPYQTSTTYRESAPQAVEVDRQPTLGRQGGAYSMGKTAFVQQGKDMRKDITDELDLAKFTRGGRTDPRRDQVVAERERPREFANGDDELVERPEREEDEGVPLREELRMSNRPIYLN